MRSTVEDDDDEYEDEQPACWLLAIGYRLCAQRLSCGGKDLA